MAAAIPLLISQIAIANSWQIEWQLIFMAISVTAILAFLVSGGAILVLWRSAAESAQRGLPTLSLRSVAASIVVLAILAGSALLFSLTSVLMPVTTKESYAKAMFGFALGCYAAFEVARLAQALWRDVHGRR